MSAPLEFPREITPALREVLGMMVFTTGPIAHLFRGAGVADFPRRVEDEQAFVLHWLVMLALEHGDEWRKHAGFKLDELAAELQRQQRSQGVAR